MIFFASIGNTLRFHNLVPICTLSQWISRSLPSDHAGHRCGLCRGRLCGLCRGRLCGLCLGRLCGLCRGRFLDLCRGRLCGLCRGRLLGLCRGRLCRGRLCGLSAAAVSAASARLSPRPPRAYIWSENNGAHLFFYVLLILFYPFNVLFQPQDEQFVHSFFGLE
jgi:hypothetical protein